MRRTIQRPALGTALLAACAVLALFNGPALAQEVARPLQAPPGKSGNTGEVGPTGTSSPAESGRLTSVAPPPKPAPAKQPTSVIPVIELALNETGEGTNERATSAPFETIYSGTANETNIPINVINATGGENSTSSEPSAGDIGSLSTGARRALHQLGGLVQGVQNTAGSAVSGISAALNRTIYSPVESALGSAANATGLSRLGRASGLGGGNETVAGNETLGAGNETAGLGGFNATDAGSMRGSDEQGTTTPRGNSDLTEPSGGTSSHMGGGRRALQQLESLVQGVRNVQNTAGNVSGVISGGLNRTIYTPVQSALNSVADATGLSALGRALGLGVDNETMAGNETLGAGNETAGANSTGDGLRQSIKDLRGSSETTPGAGRRLLGAMLRDLLQSITPGTGAVDPSAAAAGTGSGLGESTGQGAQLGGGGPLSGSSRATTADRPATTGAGSASGSGAGTGAGLGTGTGTGTGGITGTGDAGSGTGSSSTTGTRTSTTGTTGTTGTRSAAGVGRRLLDVMLRNLLQATGTNFDAPGDDATSGTGIGSSTGTTGPRVPGQSITSSTGAGSGSGSAVGSGSGTGAGLGSAAGTDSGTGTRTGGVTGGGGGTGTGAGSNTGSGTGTGTGSGKERTTGTGVGGAGTSGTGTGSTGTGSTGSMGTSGGTSGSSGVGAAARAVARAATGGGSSGTSGSG